MSIGTVQGRMNGRAKLNYNRLKQLNQAVNIPLVVHGGSGLNASQFHKLISNGVAKIDYFTALSDVAAKAMQKRSKENPDGSFSDLKKDVIDAIGLEVERCLRLWRSAGRAAEALERCEPWRSVEHLIVHNTREQSTQSTEFIIAEGKRLLARLPGVREVFTGKAMKENSKYSFCWLVRFTHKTALESFQENKAFDAFLQDQFMPGVSDLVSIDFQEKL